MAYDSHDVPSILLPCVSCNRTFRPDALAKHSKVCEKTLMKKRKQFDSSKQRIQGTDLAEFLPVLPTFTKKVDKSPVRKTQPPVRCTTVSSSSKTPLSTPKTPARCASVSSSSKTPLTSPKSKWREKHKELVQTIAAARLPAGQAPVPVKLTGQEPCPYCDRTFGPKAYDRHLEWCREQKNRIQPKSPASQRAKERQEARTKYQAPLTTKVKQRSASRDKHQGGRDQSPQPQHTPAALRRKPATTNVLESMSTPNINQNFVKGGSLRSSTRSATSVKKPQQLVRILSLPNPKNPETKPHPLLEEMRVTGYLALGTPLDLECCQLISTYEIDIPASTVATSTPHLSGGCAGLQPELNKTYTKHDLSKLLQCNPVKHCSKPRVTKRECKNISLTENLSKYVQPDAKTEKSTLTINDLTNNCVSKIHIGDHETFNGNMEKHLVVHEHNDLFYGNEDSFVKRNFSDIVKNTKLSFVLPVIEDYVGFIPIKRDEKEKIYKDLNSVQEKKFQTSSLNFTLECGTNSVFPLVVKIDFTFPFLKMDKCDAIIRQLLIDYIGQGWQIRISHVDLKTNFVQPDRNRCLFKDFMVNRYTNFELEKSINLNSPRFNYMLSEVDRVSLNLKTDKTDSNAFDLNMLDADDNRLELLSTKSEKTDLNVEFKENENPFICLIPVYETDLTLKSTVTERLPCFDANLETETVNNACFGVIPRHVDITRPYLNSGTVITGNTFNTEEVHKRGINLHTLLKNESFFNFDANKSGFLLNLEKSKVFNCSTLEEPVFNNCFDLERSEKNDFKFTKGKTQCFTFLEFFKKQKIPKDFKFCDNNIIDTDYKTIIYKSPTVQDINSCKPTPPKRMKYMCKKIEKTVSFDNLSDIHWDHYETGLVNVENFPSLKYSTPSNNSFGEIKSTKTHHLQEDIIVEKGNNDKNSFKSYAGKNEGDTFVLNDDNTSCSFDNSGHTYSNMTWDSLNSGEIDNDSISTDSSDIGGHNDLSAADFDSSFHNQLTSVEVWDPNSFCRARDIRNDIKWVDSVITKSYLNSQSSIEILNPVKMHTDMYEEEVENSLCSNPFKKKNYPSKLPQIGKKEIGLDKMLSSTDLIQNKTSMKVANLKKTCNFRENYIDLVTKCPNTVSKLPVLDRKSLGIETSGKVHWFEKYNQFKKTPNKEATGKLFQSVNLSRVKHDEGISRSRPTTIFSKSRRHQKLPPIRSESASTVCSNSSDSVSYHPDNNNVFHKKTSQAHGIDYPSELHFHKKTGDWLSKLCSLSPPSYQASEPLQPLPSTCKTSLYSECYVKPIDPWRVETNCGISKTQRMRFPRAVKKVVTHISKKRSNDVEGYDPYKSAERQMLELLEQDKNTQKLAPISPVPKSPALLSSPTSAFTKFSPIHSPGPLFIAEDDNINLPSKSPKISEKSDSPLMVNSSYDNFVSSKDSNQNPISLSTLSLCSTISIESVDSNQNGYRMGLSSSARVPEKKTPVPLRRTVSAFESRRSRDPLKGKLKMEDMLYGTTNNEKERYFGSPIITGEFDKSDDDHSSSGSLYKTISDAETLNAEQELLKSMSEFEKLLSSSSSSPTPTSPSLKLFPSLVSSYPLDDVDKLEADLLAASHAGGPDSAYSSLNRKSPVGGEQEKDTSVSEAVARFCHECGAKYPVSAAKFCCQCGVRRLFI